MKKRILSLMLVFCMVFTMVPTAAFAAETGTPSGISDVVDSGEPAVCEHEHDDTCGYAEAVEGIPATEEIPCDKTCEGEHAEDCTYTPATEETPAVEGSPCTHECELCKPVEEGEEPEQPKQDCDCTVKCTLADKENGVEETINPDCPVCGVEGADFSECKGEVPMLMAMPRGAVTEQFNLATGETYYFDLSGEVSNIGTINTAVPDTTLHYVPFTYAGTVNAYSLDSASAPDETWANSNKSDRSLFVADYNVSHFVSWNMLNTANLIFGKTFDTNYKLRSLSAGSSSGSPATNEWDSILGKSGLTDSIKNWGSIYSWGQDTYAIDGTGRAVRGRSSAAYWTYVYAPSYYTYIGWRPALEVLNPAALGSDGLKAVTLNLSGGSFNSSTNSINIVCAGENFTAPSGEGLTAPSGKVFDKWQKTGELSTTYNVGDSITYEAGLGLTALWKDLTTPETLPNATFIATGADSGTLTGLTAGKNYKYSLDDGSTWVDFTGATVTISSGISTSNGIKVVKKGNGTTTSDSKEQTINVTQATTPTIGQTDETSAGNDGTITGVTTAMEYKLSTSTTWTAITSTSVTGLSAGTYQVRVKASGAVLASENTEVTIGAFVKGTPTATDFTYDLTAVDYEVTAKPVTVTAKDGKNLGAITVKYNGSTTAPNNAGTYAITVDTAGSDEYNAVTGLSLGNYTINKIAYTGTKAVSTSVVIGGQTGATVTLPALPDGASYGSSITTGGAIAMTNMSVSDTTLTYTAPTSTAGQTGTMTIPVTGATNYTDYDIVVTVTYTAKNPQDISYATENIIKTYGDTTFTNALTKTTVNGAISYASDDTAVATVNSTTGEVTIVGAGQTIITATAAETTTHAQATASYTLTVEKKGLTLQADNKTMTKGGTIPTFTYTATGLVNGDTVTTTPTMSTTADGSTTGIFNITISSGTVANEGNYTITYAVGTLTVSDTAPTTHTITASAGTGGSITPSGTVTVNDGTEKLFVITPNNGYSIADVKVDGVSQGAKASYTFLGVTANHTIEATFSYNGSSGGGGSSSGGDSSSNDSNITVTTPPADKPNNPTEGNIKVDGKVDNKGNATVSITDKNVNDAYNKALADAKKNGNEANGITLVLNVDTGNKTANSLTVNLPKNVQDTIISKKIVNTVIVVDNPYIKINMDLSTVKEINKQAKADVNITATKQDNSKLTGNAKTAIGSRPVFDLKVNYGSGKQVSNFGTGSVAVEIPYTLSAKEKAGNVHAVYVDASGKVQWLTSSVYDSVNKVLRFSTNHFYTYGVGYKATNANFTDITNHWAKDSIEFVVARGLFSGTSNTTFSPNTAMTRGMFVTALGRLAEADVSKYKTSSFIDVKADAYYMGYVEWATKNNIVNGIGDGKFAPDAPITREQMAVIMANYAKAIGFTLPKVHAENTFADNAKINSYAKAAVKQMQMAGVISGKDGNKFDSQGTATRAEVSAVLKRFVELMIDSDTAQGWAMNDSGKWMYYENGKALTGKQTIGGVSYTFNSYGETNDTPRGLSYGTHTVVKNESWWSIAKDYKCSMFELARINNKTIFSMLYVGDVLNVPSK